MQTAASQHIPQSQLQGYTNPNPSNMPVIDEQANRLSSYQNPIKSEFGKIKGIEVLSFKEAELEKTLGGVTKFATVGILQVLYFANFDRFVLSLNDWKYALLKRMPITASENTSIGPISYTLPTYNGFYTLTIPKVTHIEGLKNLETIFVNNSRFSYKGSENILMGGGRSPDDRFRSMEYTPRELNYQTSYGGTPTSMGGQPTSMMGGQPTSMMGGQPTSMMGGQPSMMSGQPMTTSQQQESVAGPLSKGQKWKRGFKKFGHMFSRMSRKEKLNLNNYQARDIDTIKTTNEVMAPFHLYPRREVERWITYNKEISNGLGYVAEGYQDNMQNSFMGESRMRGYGSVDLGQGSLSNPIPLAGGISTVRPSLDETGYTAGQLHSVPAGSNQQGYSKIRWTDKVKSKLPGEHHYYGEKVPGVGIVHSHSIHPEVPTTLGQSIGVTPTKSTPGLLGEEFTQPILRTETVTADPSLQQQIPVTSSVEYQRTSSPINIRPVGEAYAHSFGQQPAPIIQSSELTRTSAPIVQSSEYVTRTTEPLRTSGETYYQLGEQNRLVEHQIPSNIHTSTIPSNIQTSTIRSNEYQRVSDPMAGIHGRPIGESYIKSFEQPTEVKYGESYPATIKNTENLRYRTVEQPPTISQSYQAQSFGEPSEIRTESIVETHPQAIHTSVRTAGFADSEEQEQAFQRTMTPVGVTHSSEFTSEPNVLYESGNLPSLAQRIRNTPTKPSVIAENTGVANPGSPTFIQKVKNVFTGRNESASTQSNRDVREPIADTNVPVSQMDIIRGQNAHYEA